MKQKRAVKVAPSQTKAQGIPLRWASQFPLTIRIVLSGKDENGRTFTENTQTMAVDRRAARIVTSRRIAPGTEVTVENQALGRTARAKVVWRDDDELPSKPAEVIVELIESSESGDIWGIRFPSRNDKKVPIAATSMRASQPVASAAKAAEGDSVTKPETGEPISPTASQPSAFAVGAEPEADSRIEWVDLGTELEGLTASLGKEAESFLERKMEESAGVSLATLQDDGERLRRIAEEAASFVSLASERAAAELCVAREENKASLRTHVEEYGRRLAQLSASGLEELQRRAESLLEDFRQRMQGALDALQQQSASELAQPLRQTLEDVERRCAEQLQQQALAAGKPLTEELRASVAELVDEAGKRLADVTQSCMERVTQSADAAAGEWRIQTAQLFEERSVAVGRSAESAAQSIRLAIDEAMAKLEEERRLSDRRSEEQTIAVGRSVESAAQSIQLAADEGLAKLGAARQQIEIDFHAGEDGFRLRLEELSASETEELRRQAEVLLESFESQLLQNTLQEFQEKAAQQVADQIPSITKDLLDRSANQLQQQADDTVAKLSEDLKASRMELVDDTRERITALTRASLESLGGEIKIVDEASRQKLAQSASQYVKEAVDSIKLATNEAVTAVEAAQRKVQASGEAHAEEYHKRLAELSASGIEELGRNASVLLDSFQGRLQSAVNDLYQGRATELADQLQKFAQALQECCREQLQRQTDEAFRVLNGELEASAATLVNENRELIAAAARTSLESFSGKVQAAEAESCTRLDQTASQRVQAALDSIALAADQGVAGLQATQAQVRTGLDAQAGEYEKRLAELTTSRVEDLGLIAHGLAEKFRGELQGTLDDFHRQGTTELADRLQRFVENLQQDCAVQFQGQAEDALRACTSELKASGTALVDETRERITAVVGVSLQSFSGKAQAAEAESCTRLDQTASQRVQAALDSIALAADQGVAGLQATQAQVRTDLDAQAGEYEKRLAELTTSCVEELGLIAHGLAEKFRGELQGTLDDFHRQSTTELTDRLHRLAGDLRQRGVEQLQRQAEETLGCMSDALRQSGMDLVDEARRQLTETAQVSLESFIQGAKAASDESRSEFAQTVSKSSCQATDSISLAAEQAVARLHTAQETAKASFESDAERERQRLAEVSSSQIDELQSKSDSILDGFSHLLEQTARATSDEAGSRLRGKLEQLTESSLQESESKHEALVKQQRRIFQDNIEFAAEATLSRLTLKITGLEREQRRSLLPGLALGLAGVVPTILFVYLSTRPVMRLRLDPPAEFLAAIADVAPKRQATEERVARAYWDWAYLHLQQEYSFAARLPDEPPLEMEVQGKDFPTGLEAELAKRRYWRKLQEIWLKPEAWEKSSRWDLK